MRFGISMRIALRSLSAHRLRSALTMLGIVIGIAAVITTVAVGQGAQQQVLDQLRSLGSNLLLVTPSPSRREGIRLETGRSRALSSEDAAAIAQNMPMVSAHGAYITEQGRVIAGNSNWSTLLSGVTADYLDAREWPVERGQTLTEAHMTNASKVVVLGSTVARELFGGREPVGQQVRIANTPFTVIGVLESKGQNSSGRDQDNVVFMPISTARIRVMGRSRARPDAVAGILVKVYSEQAMPLVAAEIRALLRQRHRLTPADRDDFRIRDLTQIGETREAAVRQFTWLVGIIASVSLLVGGIGIMNTMLVSVTERIRESGIRLALGAEPSDLRNQFLAEAILLSVLGGALGVGLGVGAAHLVTELLDWRTAVSGWSIVLSLGVGALIGIAFGLYPAQKAARLDPIEALRTE